MYDPNNPYTREEWAIGQRAYRNNIMYGIGGATIGLVSGIAILQLTGIRTAAPIWSQFAFLITTTLFGGCITMHGATKRSLSEMASYDKEGRLKQEVEYVMSWMGAEEKAEQQQGVQGTKTYEM